MVGGVTGRDTLGGFCSDGVTCVESFGTPGFGTPGFGTGGACIPVTSGARTRGTLGARTGVIGDALADLTGDFGTIMEYELSILVAPVLVKLKVLVVLCRILHPDYL